MAASDALAERALELVQNLEEFLGNQGTRAKNKLDTADMQLQSEVALTHDLVAELRDATAELEDIKHTQTKLTTDIPGYVTELNKDLLQARQQRIQHAKELEELRQNCDKASDQLAQLKDDTAKATEQAKRTIAEHQAAIEHWESAFALRLQPQDGGILCSFTDLDKSFKLRFDEGMITITTPQLSQVHVGAACDRFNENGDFAELMSSMRQLFQH